MIIQDIRGKKIEFGSYIRYMGTGTIGKVIEIKEENEEGWLKLEKPDLWYSSEFVEVVGENSSKSSDDKYREYSDRDNIKDLNDDFTDISLVSGGGEGGG
jgi:hypothetical protein